MVKVQFLVCLTSLGLTTPQASTQSSHGLDMAKHGLYGNLRESTPSPRSSEALHWISFFPLGWPDFEFARAEVRVRPAGIRSRRFSIQIHHHQLYPAYLGLSITGAG